MASVTITLDRVCAGGGHLHLSTSGAINRELVMDTGEVLADSSPEDLEAVIRSIVRLARQGRTLAQVRSLFAAGVTITV